MATEYVMPRDLDALRIEMRGEFALVRGELAQVRGETASMEGRLRQDMGAIREDIGVLHREIGAQARTIVFANIAAMIGIGGLVLAAVGLS